MAYRDEVEALRARLRQVEAELEERDTALRAKGDKIAGQRAQIQRLQQGFPSPSRPERLRFLAALAVAGSLIGAIAVAFVVRRLVEQAEGNDAARARAEQRAAEAESSARAARAEADRMQRLIPYALHERSGSARLNLDSTPSSYALIDGRAVGFTPELGVPVQPGEREVVFMHPDHGRKVVVVTVAAGETRSASAQF
jgi:multidrug resistance efflux pump